MEFDFLFFRIFDAQGGWLRYTPYMVEWKLPGYSGYGYTKIQDWMYMAGFVTPILHSAIIWLMVFYKGKVDDITC